MLTTFPPFECCNFHAEFPKILKGRNFNSVLEYVWEFQNIAYWDTLNIYIICTVYLCICLYTQTFILVPSKIKQKQLDLLVAEN